MEIALANAEHNTEKRYTVYKLLCIRKINTNESSNTYHNIS